MKLNKYIFHQIYFFTSYFSSSNEIYLMERMFVLTWFGFECWHEYSCPSLSVTDIFQEPQLKPVDKILFLSIDTYDEV